MTNNLRNARDDPRQSDRETKPDIANLEAATQSQDVSKPADHHGRTTAHQSGPASTTADSLQDANQINANLAPVQQIVTQKQQQDAMKSAFQ